MGSLTSSTLGELRQLLSAFHAGLSMRLDDHARFEFMLDQMWDVFTSRNVEPSEVAGEQTSVFSLDDNLDTGNASGAPFPAFVAALADAVQRWERYRMYHGPWPIPRLQNAALSFLADAGVIGVADVGRLNVGVGGGTVNLWDAICRLVVQRPGDTVAMPATGYGFFVPQVCRAGGRVLMLPMGSHGKPEPHAVASVIDRHDQESLHRWRRALRSRLIAYLDDLKAVAGTAVRVPSPAELERIIARADRAKTIRELDAVLDTSLTETVFDGDEAAMREASRASRPARLGPPRVTCYLHINPTVMGACFDASEVAQLAALLAARDVLVVEDLAYHSIRSPLARLSSVLRHDVPAILLFGVSKPFCLADCRVGVVVSDAETTRQVLRTVETSVGWVPTYVQAGLLALFESSREQIESYTHEADQGSEGYAAKRALIIACLEGTTSARLSPARQAWCEIAIKDAVTRLFAAKRVPGVDVIDEGLPGLSEPTPVAYEREITRRFCAEGLGRWLDLACDPEAGFFAVVDCARLLGRRSIGGIPLRGSFDIFALLAFLAGVRTIPEETMGAQRHNPTLLRMAFSPPCETLVQALFTTYVVLERLERWDTARTPTP